MKKIIFLFLLFLFSFQLFADDDSDKIRLAIMEIEDKSGGLDKNMLAKATEYLRSVFVNSNKFIIIPEEKQKDMLRKITKIKEDSYKDRYDKNFQINLGTALSADTILRTTISLFAGKYTVTSEIVNLSREATLKGSKETFDKNKNIEELLKKALDSIAAKIISSNGKKSKNAVSEKDLIACQKARNDRGPGGWVTYLKMFPDGECVEEAKKELDRSMCEHARRENTVEMWEKYLLKHPDGECEFDAHREILALKHQQAQREKGKNPSRNSQATDKFLSDDDACEYAESENTVESWEKYLLNYPDGKCRFEANRAILALKHDSKKEREKQAKYIEERKIGDYIWSYPSEKPMKWNQAKQYCEDLDEGGFDDWRLPNNNDFNTRKKNDTCSVSGGKRKNSNKTGKIIKTSGCGGDIENNSSWYWSSDVRVGKIIWIFNFESELYYDYSYGLYYVICVRQP